ncbi:MAG: YicC family protein [Bacteroidaceae bacterium]|nr:YicC family protein [Bacteroidaceae bacterium]
MIHSMTGFGRAEAVIDNKKIHVEVKSLNSKSTDIQMRVAPIFREKDIEIRQLVASRLVRGKIDFAIWVEKEATADASQINAALVENYHQQVAAIARQYGIPEPQDWFASLLRMPEVMTKAEEDVLSDEMWAVTLSTINAALDDIIAFRAQEGRALQEKFLEKADNIEQLMLSIEPYENERVEKIRQRIEDALKSIPNVDYDRNRLEQELIYYIEKLDISEEKQRLANHIKYFRETILNEEAQGKKLGFIAQEMGREINTTGSKSNHAEMQNIVVKMKDELEQIKEQVLNAL